MTKYTKTKSKKSTRISLIKSIIKSKTLHILIVLGAVGLTLTSLAVVHALTGSNANNRAVVAFVGDSNITFGGGQIVLNTTLGSTKITTEHLDNNYVPVVVSRVGSGIRTSDGTGANDFWKIKLGQTFSRVKPNAVVTELGINDTKALGTSTSPGYANYDTKIDYFMKLMPAGTTVFWTNLPCLIEPPSRLTGCQAVNTAISQARSRWPNLIMVPWGTAANIHPEYIDRSISTPVDSRVHYTEVGYREWAKLVMKSLDAKYPSPN